MTAEDKDILLDIYEDLARDLGWDLCYKNREEAKSRDPIRLPILLSVEHSGKNHPKWPKISHLFCEPVNESVDCKNRQDWWIAFVHMLDDAKVFLSEADRKELYQDLHNLIGHRLKRKEY